MRHTNAHSVWRRMYIRLRLIFGAAVAKSHSVHFVRIGRAKCKRVRFGYASEAVAVERNLESVAELDRFPEPVFRHENQIWVRFVGGDRLDVGRAAHVEAVLEFFGDIYRHRCRQELLADTSVQRRLLTDLDFLSEIGVLGSTVADRLVCSARRLAPERIWMGYDYIDPVRKNFVIADRGAIGIDVEALHAGQLLGIGLAKARLRWLEGEPGELLESLIRAGAPDIRPQFDYAELSFLAAYTKQKVFQGKRGYVRPADFEGFLARVGD